MEKFTDWKDELIDQARQEIEQKDKKNEKLYNALFISLMVNTMLSVVIWWGAFFYANVIMGLIG